MPVINLQADEEEKKKKPWGLMKNALVYVHKHYLDNQDWVLVTEDDT